MAYDQFSPSSSWRRQSSELFSRQKLWPMHLGLYVVVLFCLRHLWNQNRADEGTHPGLSVIIRLRIETCQYKSRVVYHHPVLSTFGCDSTGMVMRRSSNSSKTFSCPLSHFHEVLLLVSSNNELAILENPRRN